ncbi:hypothetical protein TraAM80_08225 [Trypanosoma rangeli]|uniref:Uncharacterized protein n=1 Tax=Trypanosoma rangeli TaxID=5698 RepID=A0A3R7N3C9_TRYRA|nr:uncharacterized protein TraAM80_08225 [Trypanosoma rangeli]RNE99434.1 hypothetical protein TraAM80_08225 [Trypanosoma rangeli]|eukprot:RNE99434.1 hypothetical protein TraAM80_08225 [Trypanosoma rangeli]
MGDGVYSFADALCPILEKTSLMLEGTHIIANHLLSQDEEPQIKKNGVSTDVRQLRQKPGVYLFLDLPQYLLFEREKNYICNNDVWLSAEIFLIFCYCIIHVAHEKSVTIP